MSQISRRVLFLLAVALIPGAIYQSSRATSKKPSPAPTPKKASPTPSKKASPTPSKKKVSPSSTANSSKKSTSPTPINSSKATSSPQSSPSNAIEGVFIAKSSELVLRQTKVFYLKDSFDISTGYSLTRTSRGIVAFDTRCTHAGAPSVLSGTQLTCPAHGSIFDPESGQVIRGPAVEPLKSYRTVEANEEIRIIIS